MKLTRAGNAFVLSGLPEGDVRLSEDQLRDLVAQGTVWLSRGVPLKTVRIRPPGGEWEEWAVRLSKLGHARISRGYDTGRIRFDDGELWAWVRYRDDWEVHPDDLTALRPAIEAGKAQRRADLDARKVVARAKRNA